MKFTMLGTAAYERVPSMFCSCDACKYAKKVGGKSIRTQTSALIDDCLIIDFGMDTYLHFLQNDKDFSAIEHVLITHKHIDHFFLEEFKMRNESNAVGSTNKKLELFGSKECYNYFTEKFPDSNIAFQVIKPFEKIKIGKYIVTALPAIHGDLEAFIYIIQDDKTTLYYCLDTAIPTKETNDFLKAQNFSFDIVVADCCFGWLDIPYPARHMSLIGNIEYRDYLLENRCINEKTLWILTHFSHNGLFNNSKFMTVDEMEADAKKHNMLVAYDGMELNV